MSEWRNAELGEFVEIQTGPFGSLLHAADYVLEGIPSIMPVNIGNRLNINREKIVCITVGDANRLKKYLVTENDIIYSRRGDVEKCALITSKESGWLCGTGCLRVRIISELLDPKFCAYYLSMDEIKAWVTSNAVGTTMPNLNSSILKKLPLVLPPLPEQQAIASVLSALDDKIDLLQRQNHTLEQMAATLFRQWFIEEAKEDWEEVKLGDYINCVNGVSYKSSELKDSDVALVTLKNFARDGSFRIDGFKEFVGKFKDTQIVQDDAIAVAHTDLTQDASLIGNPIRVNNILGYKALVISMDLVKVEVKSNRLTDTFLFHLLKNSDFKDHALACSNGSSVIHLSKKTLPSYIFKCPPISRINEFTERVKYIEGKAARNLVQIQTLQSMRNTLLPKLISGEVRLKGFGVVS